MGKKRQVLYASGVEACEVMDEGNFLFDFYYFQRESGLLIKRPCPFVLVFNKAGVPDAIAKASAAQAHDLVRNVKSFLPQFLH